MKRSHVSVSVRDLETSVESYHNVFGGEPSVLQEDYAKWLLEHRRINSSIGNSNESSGVGLIGPQAHTLEEPEFI